MEIAARGGARAHRRVVLGIQTERRVCCAHVAHLLDRGGRAGCRMLKLVIWRRRGRSLEEGVECRVKGLTVFHAIHAGRWRTTAAPQWSSVAEERRAPIAHEMCRLWTRLPVYSCDPAGTAGSKMLRRPSVIAKVAGSDLCGDVREVMFRTCRAVVTLEQTGPDKVVRLIHTRARHGRGRGEICKAC